MTYILVTYASKHNSTAEIAKAIGEVLQQTNAAQVDIMPIEEVKDITLYNAVILGSAVYAGQWRSKATAFLKAKETELAQRAVWLFSSGPIGDDDPNGLLKGWKFPEALQPIADRIKPHDIAVFSGKLDPTKLNLVERLMVKGVNAPTGDFRDWDLIRGWAYNIAQALQGEPI